MAKTVKQVLSKTPISPQRFEVDPTKGLICPWCPPDPVHGTIYLTYPRDGTKRDMGCMHNPFILMRRVRELESELHDERLMAYKARAFVDALRELNREIEEEGT
jgi:hypothetical protein